jgi:hypothetical protein
VDLGVELGDGIDYRFMQEPYDYSRDIPTPIVAQSKRSISFVERKDVKPVRKVEPLSSDDCIFSDEE